MCFGGDLQVDHAVLGGHQLFVDAPRAAVAAVHSRLGALALLRVVQDPGGAFDAWPEGLAVWVTGIHTRPRVAADTAYFGRALLGVCDEAAVVEQCEPDG